MRLCALFLAALFSAQAASALLECTADARFEKQTAVLTFRMGAVEHWKIERAMLMLHLAAKSEPVEVRLAPVLSPWNEASRDLPATGEASTAKEIAKPDDWVAIPIPADMAQLLTDGKATGIALTVPAGERRWHSRRTVQYSPFLAIVGEKKKQ